LLWREWWRRRAVAACPALAARTATPSGRERARPPRRHRVLIVNSGHGRKFRLHKVDEGGALGPGLDRALEVEKVGDDLCEG
jgi:hypothetical protein